MTSHRGILNCTHSGNQPLLKDNSPCDVTLTETGGKKRHISVLVCLTIVLKLKINTFKYTYMKKIKNLYVYKDRSRLIYAQIVS